MDGLHGSGASVSSNVTVSSQPRAPNLGCMCPRRSMNVPQEGHSPPEKIHTFVCLGGGGDPWFLSGSQRR